MHIVPIADIHNDIKTFKMLVQKLLVDFEKKEKPVVLICGDLQNSPGDKFEGEFVTEIIRDQLYLLNDNGFMTMITPGNHDVGWSGISYEIKALKAFKMTFDTHYPSFDRNDGVEIIVLDSTAGGEDTLLAAGELGVDQLNKFEDILISIREEDRENDTDTPIVVFMHHHPVARFNHSDSIGMELNDAKEYRRLCIMYNVSITIHGHRHGYQGVYYAENIYTLTPGRMNDSIYMLVEIKDNGEIWSTFKRIAS